MVDPLQHQTRPTSIWFYLLAAGALLIVINSFALLSPILLSFLLILLISLAINPLVLRLRTMTGGRRIATVLLATSLLTAVALTGWAFSGPLKASIFKFSEQLPRYWERIQKPLIRMEKKAVLSEEKLQAEVTKEIAQVTATNKTVATSKATVPLPAEPAKPVGTLRSSLGQMLHGVAGSFSIFALNAAQISVVMATVFFGVIFTLMNPRPVVGSIFSVVPVRHHETTLVILQRIGKFMPNWALATLLAMTTVGVLVFLIMWPFFGFMDALVLGVIAGILEAVPYVGPILSALPGLMFAFGKGGATPLWILLVYLAVQALENNVISPLIMARSMKLHPVAVIFSMLLCVAAFGVLGVLIAPPMVAIVRILHDELYRKRFLGSATDADLERLSRKALGEKVSEDNAARLGNSSTRASNS